MTRTIVAVLAATLGLPAETFRYTINWPTGLSLGEAELSTRPVTAGKDAASRLEHRFQLDASVPGFAVSDRYRSLATAGHCSIEFEKSTSHGTKRSVEVTKFDPGKRIAIRETKDGGKSEMPAAECAHDALSYLGFLRHEVAQGRLPGPMAVFFGASYQLSVKFGGTQRLKLESGSIDVDRIEGTVAGPVANIRFEMFFSKDPSRKLVMARVPLPVGSFSMELID